MRLYIIINIVYTYGAKIAYTATAYPFYSINFYRVLKADYYAEISVGLLKVDYYAKILSDLLKTDFSWYLMASSLKKFSVHEQFADVATKIYCFNLLISPVAVLFLIESPSTFRISTLK
jgi:hypothetical protein